MKAGNFFCFGHRGARGHEPENTLRAVRKALALGANGIEVDVHLADGHLMVIHDDTLERTTNGKGAVAEKSFSCLRSLDAGLGEPIPTLAEIFDAVNRRALINVELKGPATAEPVTLLIEEYVRCGWRYEDFLVSSFDFAQIRAAATLQPALRTGALIEEVPRGLAAPAERLGAWSLHCSKKCVTDELVADAHRRGLKLFAYTINAPDDIAAMVALGVDGVFTDYPDRVLAFLQGQNSIRR
ncbi:MAG: glycerophosphodiester phosphodiesterase [Verrucomicrobia bacterium]|nr:glycerophosphodiester phosphodiesterase [Verrucomicrobiota bacterium]MDE3100425.1 glycerophosphodiester phosphodiesterase [Verrucomicrobiota bacterium]